ncbi:diaminopimelate epimerase [Flavobacterium sp.]|uniref:diaminopimelate epimerase n=1 Tax=Flavobacterium sp. TaxID=239 RepID=UPI00286D73F3|nr:diaminopimelate epimerase [Flavobacterium sp.]
MQFTFYKYQGTGNDFVMIDNRQLQFPKNDTKIIERLCDRRFGIGGDGLILLENDEMTDFKMVYYNSDGNQSSMCGNGGRCLVAFAKKLNVIKNKATFIAIDGLHYATIDENDIVSLQMIDVSEIKINPNFVFLNTGSPHHIIQVENLNNLDVKTEGSKIRYSDLYGQVGSNVNFVTQISNNEFSIRTYERGVEDETLSCGTGATAVAIAMHATKKSSSNNIKINVEGGALEVSFEEENGIYKNVFLKGPATFVFETSLTIE